MPEILWKTDRPDKRKLNQPEGASSYYLDAYAANDGGLASRIWREFGGPIGRVQEIDSRRWMSSWNWWPAALAARLLADDLHRQALVEKLIRYCRCQLNREAPARNHDLWGAETLSRIYSWPISVMAVLHDWAKDNNVEAAVGPLTDLLRAHAYTLALFALPDPYPGSDARELFVCAPGMRSHKFHKGQALSFITACILNADKVRDKPNALQRSAKPRARALWPARLAWRARHEYLSEDEREMLKRHVEKGDRAAEIVKVLNGLGVSLRTPVQVWRYKDGDFLALAERNVQGSTPPIMAMSRVDGKYRHLSVHPPGMRGEGRRRLGNPSKCWRENDQVRTYFKDAVVSANAQPVNLEGSMPAPFENDELLYAARFGKGFAAGGESVWLMTQENRVQEEDAQRERILANSKEIAKLSENRPAKLFKHGQAIGRLVDRKDTEQIRRHARAIERIGPRSPEGQEKKVYDLALKVIDLGEWWA